MTTADLAERLELKPLAGTDTPRALEGCYVGDLLSWVMGRAGEQNVWITVMGNVNAIAVAKLAEIGCIVLCENAHLDDDAKAQADANHIPVYQSEHPAYQLALAVDRFYSGAL